MGKLELELARDAYAAFNRGDPRGALRHIDPAIEWRMSERFARGARVFHGHEGVLEVWEMFREALDDVRTEPQALHDAGDAVVAEVRISGRIRGTDELQAFDLVQVWTIRDRLAIRLDVYSTLKDACDAVGMTPPPATSDSTSTSASGRANR